MRITVHRGSNQIGGCVTEYESNGWKLFVDYGEQLPGAPMSDKNLEIDGLTCGDLQKSALLITHYHGDHIGKITELPPELPIYMGKMAKEIASELANHLSTVSVEHRKMAERLNNVNTFVPRKHFTFGEFDITPIVVDHSAFDAYAFCIEAKGLKVFHSGDFRKHGFRYPDDVSHFLTLGSMKVEQTYLVSSTGSSSRLIGLSSPLSDAFSSQQ